ncbi:MAG: hypothetical protein V2B20_13315 [Pseudomonadota bacterium]
MTPLVTVSQTKAITLTEVQSRFAAWREKRKNSRSAIPEELWSAAVMLCMENSVHKISRGLRLSHTELKNRVASCGSSLTCSAMPTAQDFITINIPRMDNGAAVIIEKEHRNGNRMTMHFKGQADLDPQAFAKAFWG